MGGTPGTGTNTSRISGTGPGGASGTDRSARSVVTAVVLAVFSLVPVFLTSALAPRIRSDIAITESHLGIAVSAFFATSAVGNLALGPVADRFGGVRTLRLLSLPSGCALAFVALGVHSWVPLALALALAGIGNGGVQTAANEILARTVSPARQGIAFGAKQASIPAAALLSGLAVPAIGATVGWRWGFGGAAVSALVLGQYLPWATNRRSPGRVGASGSAPAASPASTAANGVTAGDVDGSEASRTPGGHGGHSGRSGSSRLLLMAAGAALSCAAANSLGAFFVLAATRTGLDDVTAGLLTGVGGLSSITVRLLAGHLIGRRGHGQVYGAAGLAAVGTAGYLLLALMRSWSMLPAVVIAYGAGWGWMGLLAFAAARRFPHAPGRATGVVQAGAAVGGCLGPLVFGLVVTGLGYPATWTAVAAVNCLGAAVLTLSGRMSRAQPRDLLRAEMIGDARRAG